MRSAPLLLLFAAAVWPAAAQTWDSSGNSMLKGTYYFREVFYQVGDNYGDLYDAAALYGNITFDGNGNYSITSTSPAILIDAASGSGYWTATGTYSVSASGYGSITNPALKSTAIYGLVAQNGIFIGSSTEGATTNGYNDLFIAAPVSSATNATLKGTYTIANLDATYAIEQGDIGYMTGSMFTVNPDGNGNLGSFTINGYVGGSGASPFSQIATTIKYAFSNSAASFTIPSSNNAILLYGQQYIYISPDGNFIFGGSSNSWNMFVGVRTGTTSSAPNFSGLYYQAGVDEDESNYATSGAGLLDTYFGSLSATSGTIIGHQRQVDLLLGNPYGLTYSDTYNVPSSGAYTSADGFTKYVVGAGGAVRIGSGLGPYLGLSVALAAPSPSGSGVWINPQGVVNAASYAPFTAGIAPGELITITGSNLASGTQVASTIPFPTTLNNVQVMINGTAAPIYYVSSSQISVIVPYEVSGASIANITVNNNGTTSNSVSQLIDSTAPGVFTQTANGIGPGSVLHAADYSLVTTQHPAVAGETIAVYLTGLGTVSPTISDGAAGPSTTLSQTTNTIAADISGTTATVGFAGLAPGLAGLYQINLTVPTGLTAGNNILDIQGPDSYNAEAILPVGSGSTSAAAPEKATPAVDARRRHPAVQPMLRQRAPVGISPRGAGTGESRQ